LVLYTILREVCLSRLRVSGLGWPAYKGSRPVRMSTGPFEFLFLQMVLQMLISADLTMIDLILLHILIKNYVLDKVWKDFGRRERR